MAKNDALITPQLLVWARERVAMPVDLAAKAAGVATAKYQSWEQGEQLPTVNQAKKFAKKVKIPYAWFFLATPPEKYKLPKNTDYRTFANQATPDYSIELQYLIADVSMRRDAMIELYTEMDIPIPHFEQYMDANTSDISSVAQTIRSLLGITLERQKKFKNGSEAFNYYMEALSALGILVFQAGKLDKNIMRGLSIYDPVFPIIVVNRKDEFNARIFTLFHEFVHILTRTPGICDSLGLESKTNFDIEIKCNQVAAEALVPQEALLTDNYWTLIEHHGWNDDVIQKIAKNFSVSREVIIGRLLTLNKITIDFYIKRLAKYTKEYEEYKRNQRQSKDGFLPPSTDICSQVGKFYARTIISAYNQDLITPRDVSHFFSGLRVQHFGKVERWCFS